MANLHIAHLDSHMRDGRDIPKSCTCCGEPAENGAVWFGVRATILICAKCAERVLPSMFADALNYPAYGLAHAALKSFAAAFWKALACRLMRTQEFEG